jgi:hypothetical protein
MSKRMTMCANPACNRAVGMGGWRNRSLATGMKKGSWHCCQTCARTNPREKLGYTMSSLWRRISWKRFIEVFRPKSQPDSHLAR